MAVRRYVNRYRAWDDAIRMKFKPTEMKPFRFPTYEAALAWVNKRIAIAIAKGENIQDRFYVLDADGIHNVGNND
jgi:hypothetical protein